MKRHGWRLIPEGAAIAALSRVSICASVSFCSVYDRTLLRLMMVSRVELVSMLELPLFGALLQPAESRADAARRIIRKCFILYGLSCKYNIVFAKKRKQKQPSGMGFCKKVVGIWRFFTKTSLGGRFVLKHCRDLPGWGTGFRCAACGCLRYPWGWGLSKHRSLRNLKVPGCFVSCPLCEQAPNWAENQNSPALCAELQCFERKTGFGPATSTLARLRSTN